MMMSTLIRNGGTLAEVKVAEIDNNVYYDCDDAYDDINRNSGSREGEDRGSKEVRVERSRVQVLEGWRVVQEKGVVVWDEFGQD